MNNIKIDSNIIEEYNDNNIEIKNNNITFKVSGDYKVEYTNKTNNDINIVINDNVEIKLYIKSINNEIDNKVNYILNENSKLKISKYFQNNITNQSININLNGEKSNIIYNFSEICKKESNYDIKIYHNNKKTNSILSNKCISLENSITNFYIDSILPKGNIGCMMDQTTKIMEIGNADSHINPNMYIDESDVEAKHGSVIGKFDENNIFYLMSRGISRKESILLLIKGFILSNIEVNDDEKSIILNEIEENWR